MQKPLPISVCMISGAEARRIGAALEGLANWTLEVIVVLNQEAHDGTEQIAAQLGAKVFREPWKGHVAQKNSAAQKASGDWILGLDSDEVVPPDLRGEIEATFADPARIQGVAAFSFPRLSWYAGRWIRHGDWYPDRQTRLWRRGQAHWGGTNPHDKLLVNGRIEKLRAPLHHFSNNSIAGQISKIAPYQEEFVKQRLAAGDSAGLFELAVRPAWRFVRAYLLRLGFLDGWQGFYIAALSSFSTLTRYALIREASCRTALPPVHSEIKGIGDRREADRQDASPARERGS